MKQNIKIDYLTGNEGQIKGLPANPRFIKDHQYEKLKQSIIDHPEMLDIRELLVFPLGKKYVIVGGNMRMRAIQEVIEMPASEFDPLVNERRESPDFLTWFTAIMQLRDKKEIPCKVLDRDTPVERLRAYVVKDNLGYGQWDHDMLANEWDTVELEHWGLEVDIDDEEEGDEPLKVLTTTLTVECDDPNQLDELYLELQRRGFKCELSK